LEGHARSNGSSSEVCNHYSAYRYITKALHSPSHPDLRDALKTEKAIAAKKRKGKILKGVAQRRKIGR